MELYVISWPEADTFSYALCLVVMLRQGGALIALPSGFVSVGALQGAEPIAGVTLGLHTAIVVPAVILESGSPQVVGQDLDVILLGVSDAVIPLLVPYSQSPVVESELTGFAEDPSYLPDPVVLMKSAKEWIEVVSRGPDPDFYSAEEVTPPAGLPEAKVKAKAKPGEKAKARSGAALVADQIKALSALLPVMAEQLSTMQEEQKRMQTILEGQSMVPPMRPSQVPVSLPAHAFAQMMGSPPRTKGVSYVPPPPKTGLDPAPKVTFDLEEERDPMEGSTLAHAVYQQSKALTSLVSHLQQGGDPLLDHQAMSSTTSSRGAAGRERLQRELSDRSGNFFLQVMQNAFKRMKPATPTPPDVVSIAAVDFSMIQYLERCGGYGNSKEMGLVMYGLAFVADAAAREDMAGVQEHLAVLLVAIEQAVQDQGKWDLAFQLLLAEDPPPGMFTYKGAGIQGTGRAKAFSPLCPQKWATVALAFAKEMDYIQTRRNEAAKKPPVNPQQGPSNPNPKKKGRYPKSKAQDRLEEEQT